LKDSQPASEIK